MTKHKKVYSKYGNGVELRCGEELIASNPHRGANFSFDGCPICGMEVTTIGCSPETDKVEEYTRSK